MIYQIFMINYIWYRCRDFVDDTKVINFEMILYVAIKHIIISKNSFFYQTVHEFVNQNTDSMIHLYILPALNI